MTQPRRSFITRSIWYRAGYSALLAVGGLGIPVLLLVAIALFGGRYQTVRRSSTEYDAWLLAAAYPIGLAIAGAVAGAAAPWIRRAWQAGVVGFVAALPSFVFFSLTIHPRGDNPYSVHWPLAATCAFVLGVPVGVLLFRGAIPSTKFRKRRVGSNRHAV